VFVASSVVSLVLIYFYITKMAKRVDHIAFRKLQLRNIFLAIVIVVNIFYFSNTIPPVPLAIRESGVYHSVSRRGADYRAEKEVSSFLDKLLPGQTIHKSTTTPVYVFTSIFAPSELSTIIIHHWQFYDEDANAWISRDRLNYTLIGGRQDGYRGYTLKSALEEGKWRVDVETKRGQVIGRIRFDYEKVDIQPETIINLL